MTYILGIHGFSSHNNRMLHDTGVTLLKNNKILYAVNEERFSRKKKDGSFPWKSYINMLESTEIHPQDIKAVAFADKKPFWQLFNVLKYSLKAGLSSKIFLYEYLKNTIKRTKYFTRKGPKELSNKPQFFIEHHLAHAASAYYTSPWNKATIITLDGMGDYCIGGVLAKGKNEKIKILKKTNGFFSPGIFYMIITEYLGYTPGIHEGKVMGLAAYGDPRVCYKEMENFIQYQSGQLDFFSKPIMKLLNKCTLTKKCNLTFLDEYFGGYSKKDIAAAAQKRLEDIVVSFIGEAFNLTEIKNLVLAGGVFANVKLNQFIKQKLDINNIYIHPNMNDGGLATGAALYTYYNNIRNIKINRHDFIKTIFYGPDYNNLQIKQYLTNYKRDLKFQRMSQITEKIADALAQHKIIGHFFWRMEYGPRALGIVQF